MNESTDVIAKEESIVWSGLLHSYSALLSPDHTVSISPMSPIIIAISLKRFFRLPDSTVREIISYFPLSERSDLLRFKPNNRLFIFQENLRRALTVEQSVDIFIHMMTLDGPDNQKKAREMLDQHPEIANKLMSMPREMIGDAAQQFSQPISAYEYAWCVDDTPMCQMLEQYMNEGIKAKVLQQCKIRAVEKFMYLITREGENNQNKAEAMLIQHPNLVAKLISSQTDTRDTVRRFIKPISAYEYVSWAGDTRMHTMLNKYISQNESLKDTVYAQYKNLVEHGIDFEMISRNGIPVPKSTVLHSKHFDYQPLQNAYNAYKAEASQLINDNKNSEEDWVDARALWLKVGIEWAKAPVYSIQEICSSRPFHPLQGYPARLTNTNLVRTVKFYNCISKNNEYLVHYGSIHANLGILFSIYKGLGVGAGAGGRAAGDGRKEARSAGWLLEQVIVSHDSTTVATLSTARTVDDLKQTLVDLRPTEHRAHLSL